jgi:hypothetical protein
MRSNYLIQASDRLNRVWRTPRRVIDSLQSTDYPHGDFLNVPTNPPYRAGDFLRTRRRAIYAPRPEQVQNLRTSQEQVKNNPNTETAGAWQLVILCAVLLAAWVAWG